jgi:hypothetical protein
MGAKSELGSRPIRVTNVLFCRFLSFLQDLLVLAVRRGVLLGLDAFSRRGSGCCRVHHCSAIRKGPQLGISKPMCRVVTSHAHYLAGLGGLSLECAHLGLVAGT